MLWFVGAWGTDRFWAPFWRAWLYGVKQGVRGCGRSSS